MVEYKAVKYSREREGEEHPEIVEPKPMVFVFDVHPALIDRVTRKHLAETKTIQSRSRDFPDVQQHSV